MKEKFIKKYMRVAKLIGEDNNPCYSRNIGVVLVSPETNRIIGTGYNGPPKNTPHCDSYEYLHDVVWERLSLQERKSLIEYKENTSENDIRQCFAKQYEGCRTCPRKLLGLKSGERLEICSCHHAETNAITNCAESTKGCYAFCWCGVPCWNCTQSIINAEIAKVFCIEAGPDYSFGYSTAGSRWLFKKAGVDVILHDAEYYLTD